LFRGELGETLLVVPPKDSLGAKKLLAIGLGDSQSFSPQWMQLIGEILYSEASSIGVSHPFFAPTILDGGVAKFTTGEIAEQVIGGFLRAAATDRFLREANASPGQGVTTLTYLAGQLLPDIRRYTHLLSFQKPRLLRATSPAARTRVPGIGTHRCVLAPTESLS
jgi:hypothetical protein